MNKKLSVIIMIVFVCIVLAGVCFAAITVSEPNSIYFWAGQFFESAKKEEAKVNSNNQILAKYNGLDITSTMVDYAKNINSLTSEVDKEATLTDLEIINNIALGRMLYEEAVRLGLSATNEEIEEAIQNACLAYSVPEGKQMMDDFLKGAGITFDEYLDIYRKQLPETIARQKLIDTVGKMYCEANGLEFTKVNPPQEMLAAQEAYKRELFEKNKSEIEYLVDTSQVS